MRGESEGTAENLLECLHSSHLSTSCPSSDPSPQMCAKDTCGRLKMALNAQSEMGWLSPHHVPNWLCDLTESGDLSKLIPYLQDESQEWQPLLHWGVCHLKAVTYRRAL